MLTQSPHHCRATTRYSQNQSVQWAIRRAAAHACCAMASASDAVARVDQMPSGNWWHHHDSASMMKQLLMTMTTLMLMLMAKMMAPR
jgi:hypothetical protein